MQSYQILSARSIKYILESVPDSIRKIYKRYRKMYHEWSKAGNFFIFSTRISHFLQSYSARSAILYSRILVFMILRQVHKDFAIRSKAFLATVIRCGLLEEED